MKNILMLEGSSKLLKSIKPAFKKYEDKIDLLVTADIDGAIDLLKKMPISVVVADLFMLEIDDLGLLAYMSRHHPTIPCIITAAFRSPEEKEILANMGIYHFLEKPFEPESLLKIIAGAIRNAGKGEVIRTLSTTGFLQLLQVQQKSCSLEAINQTGVTGSFYLVEGKLSDAKCGGLKGEEAVLDILGWDNVSFYLKDLPTGDIKDRIKLNLKELSAKAPIPKKEYKKEKPVPVRKESISEVFALAVHNAELGNNKTAQHALAKILKLKPNSSKVWLWFARTAPDFKTINISLSKAATISPDDAEIAEEINKLKSAAKSGCGEDSVLKHCFFCWAPLLDGQTICHYCYARVDIHEGFFQAMFFESAKEPELEMVEESLKRFTKASKSSPRNATGHFHLAMAHVNMNHWTEALKSMERANNVDPNHLYREQLDILTEFVEDTGSFGQD